MNPRTICIEFRQIAERGNNIGISSDVTVFLDPETGDWRVSSVEGGFEYIGVDGNQTRAILARLTDRLGVSDRFQQDGYNDHGAAIGPER